MASFFTSSGLILLCTNPCTSFWPCWSLWNLVSLFPGPLLLGIFLFGINNISFGGCLLQIFSMHSFTLMESGILLAMSVDHFVAIYSPLRYTIILTILRISRMGVTIAFHSVVLVFPLLLLLKHLLFCSHNTLTHSYCLHSDLIKLPCGDTHPNSILGLFVISFTFGLDSLLIVISCMLILHTVLGIASGAGRWRALNTCVSHTSAVPVYYVPIIILSLIHRFGHHLPLFFQTVMASVYLFFPPVANRIVYSIKTKEVLRSIVRHCLKRGVWYLRGYSENTGTWIRAIAWILDFQMGKLYSL